MISVCRPDKRRRKSKQESETRCNHRGSDQALYYFAHSFHAQQTWAMSGPSCELMQAIRVDGDGGHGS